MVFMETLFVIDAYNLIYRMFYAVPEMHTREGIQVNAIFWVAKFLQSLALENPTSRIVVANDVGKSFRANVFEAYKAQRDRMPDNLRSQIEGVFSLFESAWIPILSEEWYEADDIIWSIAIKCQRDYGQVVIISSDKDLCQFVQDGCVHIYDAMKRKFMKRSDVVEKFGVPPEQVRDYLAIVGDISDNIPGINGFWPKKAVSLLSEFQTLESVYESIGVRYENQEFSFNEEQYQASSMTERQKGGLFDQKENAFLSKYLATIVTDLSVENFESPFLEQAVRNRAYLNMLKKYEFRSLVPKDPFEEEEEKPEISVISLETHEAVEAVVREREWEKKVVTVSFSPSEGLLYLSIDQVLYSMDIQRLDISPLTEFLLHPKSTVVWYNIKSLLHALDAINKPLNAGVEGQASLF